MNTADANITSQESKKYHISMWRTTRNHRGLVLVFSSSPESRSTHIQEIWLSDSEGGKKKISLFIKPISHIVHRQTQQDP
jgi:hypothetical protein